MQRHIAIGVRDDAMGVRNPHAAQHHRVTDPETVHVAAVTDSHAPPAR
jgi:hypothetical protein